MGKTAHMQTCTYVYCTCVLWTSFPMRVWLPISLCIIKYTNKQSHTSTHSSYSPIIIIIIIIIILYVMANIFAKGDDGCDRVRKLLLFIIKLSEQFVKE